SSHDSGVKKCKLSSVSFSHDRTERMSSMNEAVHKMRRDGFHHQLSFTMKLADTAKCKGLVKTIFLSIGDYERAAFKFLALKSFSNISHVINRGHERCSFLLWRRSSTS